MPMKKKTKAYLIFSLVYWSLIITGLTLFAVSFGTVRFNHYGIKRNYYTSQMDTQIHISGLYHIGVGNYFVQFPSSKVCIQDIKVNVTNSDMNVMQITYSLVYRIVKAQTKYLYLNYSTDYQARIVSTVNSIVSNYFIGSTQEESRVSLQSDIVTEIISSFSSRMPVLGTAIQLQAFFFNQINFLGKETDYDNAYLDSSSYSEAYESMEVEMLKTNMEVQTLNNLIETVRNNLTLTVDTAVRNATESAYISASYLEATQQIMLSLKSKVGQIFEYYRPPQFQLL